MPSRPSLPPPPAPKGATPVRLEAISQYSLKRPKVGRNAYSCLLMFLIALIVIIAVGAYVVARTGLVRVPYFSKFYHPIAPTRIVDAEPISSADFVKLVQERVLAASTTRDGAKNVQITETEMTGLLRGVIADRTTSTSDMLVKRIQAVVGTSSIELSGSVQTKVGEVNAFAQIFPSVTSSSNVSFIVQKAYLGELPVSTALVERMRQSILTNGGMSWGVKLGSMSLKDIHLQDGSLLLTFVSSTSATSTR